MYGGHQLTLRTTKYHTIVAAYVRTYVHAYSTFVRSNVIILAQGVRFIFWLHTYVRMLQMFENSKHTAYVHVQRDDERG